jgi:hypothetical protein
VRLFTPLSDAEADQAERGALYGEFLWFDRPRVGEAGEDAVWVAIDVPDNRVHRFETRSDEGRAYREFRLPTRVTNLHQAQRVEGNG